MRLVSQGIATLIQGRAQINLPVPYSGEVKEYMVKTVMAWPDSVHFEIYEQERAA